MSFWKKLFGKSDPVDKMFDALSQSMEQSGKAAVASYKRDDSDPAGSLFNAMALVLVQSENKEDPAWELLKNESDNLIGIWIANSKLANDAIYIRSILTHEKVSEELRIAVMKGYFHVEPNKRNNKGGSLVWLESEGRIFLETGSNTEIDVIIGFFLQTSSGFGAIAESIVDASGLEKTQNRLREELGFTENIPVKIFYENEWKMPKVNKQEDVYNQGVLTTIVDRMCAAFVELDVTGVVINDFKRKDFEVLQFPTSGRVLLFQAIRLPQNDLEKLVGKSKQPKPGESQRIDNTDGTEYPSVEIGTQVWMTENLNVDRFRNGDPIPEAKSDAEWKKAGDEKKPAWCYYDNNPENGKIYGKLYNWYAVNDPRGLAPEGWHVPSDKEWTILTEYLGGKDIEEKTDSGITFWYTPLAGGKMKSTGTKYWNSPNEGATNSSGFSGLPGGFREYSGDFANIVGFGNWWSSSEFKYDAGFAWVRNLAYGFGKVLRYANVKRNGLSVRCLKD